MDIHTFNFNDKIFIRKKNKIVEIIRGSNVNSVSKYNLGRYLDFECFFIADCALNSANWPDSHSPLLILREVTAYFPIYYSDL